MRHQIIALLVSLLCLTSPAAWGQSGAAVTTERGALFKLEAGAHTLYLFGTIHVGQRSFFPLEARLTGALARASVLALELDPLRDPAAMARAVREHGLYAPGSADQNNIPPALRARLERALRTQHVQLATVAPYKPWLLMTLLALSQFAAQDYHAELAVDLHLAQLAREKNIPIVELESVTAQLSLFDAMSIGDQWRLVEELLDGIESGQQSTQVRAITAAWRHADRAALDALALDGERDPSFSARFMQRVLLAGRNPALAEKIAQLLARETNSVAAIGVLHLVGQGSVPQLLRARGVLVTRVY